MQFNSAIESIPPLRLIRYQEQRLPVQKCFFLISLISILTLLLLNTTCPVSANSVDPDQLASEEANWSESALFVIKYVNFYQKLGSRNLIGWKLEIGVAS